MKKKLRWKVILVVGVIALAVFLAYPPGEKIHLGLDLQGGIHLVLQVVTDDAVTTETDQEIIRLREELNKKNIDFQSVSKTDESIGKFTIQNFDLEKEGQIREILDEYFRNWDYTSRGTFIEISMKATVESYLRDQAVRQARETLSNRVDELGLTEPTIQRQGLTGERIIVELPGVEDPERVKEILKTTALLEFRLVKGGPASTEEQLLAEHGGTVPEERSPQHGRVE
jgi:preprotein translocase subunit SecD